MFCVKKVRVALDTGAECESEEAKTFAPLSLDNQCMAQIPLSENTLASQLIINSIFFFLRVFFSCWLVVGQGEVRRESMEPLCDPHVLVGKRALPQLARPNDWCCHSFEKERNKCTFLCRGLELGGRMRFSVWTSRSWTRLDTIDSVVEMCTTLRNSPRLPTHQLYSESLWEIFCYLDVLIRVLKSFVPEKDLKKNDSIFYLFFTLKITCFL